MDKNEVIAKIIEKLKGRLLYSQGQLDDIQTDLQEWSQTDLDNLLNALQRPTTAPSPNAC